MKINCLILLLLSLSLFSCGSENEPNSGSEKYYGEFLDLYGAIGVMTPAPDKSFATVLKSFIPFDETTIDEVATYDHGSKKIVTKYTFLIDGSTATLTFEKSGEGHNVCYMERTTSIFFSPGEYEKKDGGYTIVYIISSDKILVYEKYGESLFLRNEEPNPQVWTDFIGDSWEEPYVIERSVTTINLSVGRINDYKVILSNDTFEFEFNPKSLMLTQIKPEFKEIGTLSREK